MDRGTENAPRRLRLPRRRALGVLAVLAAGMATAPAVAEDAGDAGRRGHGRHVLIVPRAGGVVVPIPPRAARRSATKGSLRDRIDDSVSSEPCRSRRARAVGRRRRGVLTWFVAATLALLLGGAIIRAGDLVIDGSIRGKLERLGSALTH